MEHIKAVAPQNAALADDALAKIQALRTAKDEATGILGKIREAADSKLEFQGKDGEAGRKALRGLKADLATATNDPDRMAALDKSYRELGEAKQTPAIEALRGKLREALSDPAIFGPGARNWAEHEAMLAAMNDSAGKVRAAFHGDDGVSSSKVSGYVNKAARGDPGIADKTAAFSDLHTKGQAYLDWIKENTYGNLAPGRVAESASKTLEDLEASRLGAVASKAQESAEGKPPGSMAEALRDIHSTRDSAIAMGLHYVGLGKLLPFVAVAKVMGNPTQALHVVGLAAGKTAQALGAITAGVRDLFSSAAPSRAAGALSAGILKDIGDPKRGETRAEAVQRVADHAATMASGGDNITAGESALQRHAPQTAALVLQKGQQISQYLAQNAPQRPGGPRQPWEQKTQPGDAEVARYERIAQAARNSEQMLTLRSVTTKSRMPLPVSEWLAARQGTRR